ncbi:serine/threonine-protein kinase PDIK1L-like [Glandiceps talaboti]
MENYQKLKRLGSGAFGSVYLLQHKKSKKKYAGKRIECDDGEELECVMKEMMNMAKLEHKNIVSILDSHVDREDKILQVWLIMEYCNHGNMDDYFLKESRLEDMSLKLDVMMQVIGAVNYIHSKRMVHRDLKPANILITSKGDDVIAKVADFGVSRFYDTLGRDMKTITGTPVFMAPEIVKLNLPWKSQPAATYSEKCDVFSLGITMYSLFTNSVVKRCISYLEKGEPVGFNMVSARRIPKTIRSNLQSLSELGKLILSMLAYDSDERPSAAQLVSEFYPIVSSSTVKGRSSRREKTQKSEWRAPSGYAYGGEINDSSDEESMNTPEKPSQRKSKKGSRIEDVFFEPPMDTPSSSLASADPGYYSERREGHSKPKQPQKSNHFLTEGDADDTERMAQAFFELAGFKKKK